MALYTYTAAAIGTLGPRTLQGLVTADSPRQARDQLRAQGLSVQDLVEQGSSVRRGGWAWYRTSRSRGRVTGFLQELSTLLSAGIPLLEALDTSARQHAGAFRQSVLLLREHVATGGSLAQAMKLQPVLYDEVCCGVIEVGQNAGTLDTSLARLVEYRRKSESVRDKVTSAMIYPAIVLAVGLVVSLFLMTFVVPNLLSVLVDSGKPLPASTLIVKTMSDTLLAWWWVILPSVLAAGLGLAAWLRTESGQIRWQTFQLRLPLLGDLIAKQAIARMAMVMATLLRSDVTFIRSVQIVGPTVRNRVLRSALDSCEHAVTAGRDIAAALEKTGVFPPLVVQIFAVGQASGRLEEMLEGLSRDYDVQVDIASGRLTALLEPVMMILLAIVVGFIGFATILPILEAGNIL